MEATNITLSALTTKIKEIAEHGTVALGWHGKVISYKGENFTLESLWTKVQGQVEKSARTETTWAQVALCERNICELSGKLNGEAPANSGFFLSRIVKAFLNWFRKPVFYTMGDINKHQELIENTFVNQAQSQAHIEARRTLLFAKHFDDEHKYESLRKLLAEAKTPLDDSTATQIVQEITQAPLMHIPRLLNLSAKSLACTDEYSRSTLLPSDLTLTEKEILQKLVTKIQTPLSPLFFDKVADAIEGVEESEKPLLKTLFADLDHVSDETLRPFLIDPKKVKNLYKVLSDLEKSAPTFTRISGIDIKIFVDKTKKTLLTLLPNPDVRPESLKTLLPEPMQNLFLSLMKDPVAFNKDMKTVSPEDHQKNWTSILTIVSTLGTQKDNLAAELAAITILEQISPPSQNSTPYDNDELSFIAKTAFSQQVVEAQSAYKECNKDILRKALSYYFIKGPRSVEEGYDKSKKPDQSPIPFLLGIDTNPYEYSTETIMNLVHKPLRGR